MPGLMELQSPGKLVALVVVIVGCFAMILLSALQPDAGIDATPAWAMLTLVTGYLIGNGAGAAQGKEQQPVFKPTEDPPVAPRAVPGG